MASFRSPLRESSPAAAPNVFSSTSACSVASVLSMNVAAASSSSSAFLLLSMPIFPRELSIAVERLSAPVCSPHTSSVLPSALASTLDPDIAVGVFSVRGWRIEGEGSQKENLGLGVFGVVPTVCSSSNEPSKFSFGGCHGNSSGFQQNSTIMVVSRCGNIGTMARKNSLFCHPGQHSGSPASIALTPLLATSCADLG